VRMIGPVPAGPDIRPRHIPARAAISAERAAELAQPMRRAASSTPALAHREITRTM
jgi:hypothetical protein